MIWRSSKKTTENPLKMGWNWLLKKLVLCRGRVGWVERRLLEPGGQSSGGGLLIVAR
jgi:hypothetical protein